MNRFKFSSLRLPLGIGLRESIKEGYTKCAFFKDISAGVTVSILAVPMTMAVSIASGVPPEYGLYGAMIAGPIIALLGGARLSVCGPVAELAVLLYPVVHQFGLSGALLATWMAGLLLLVMGIGKLGKMIEFIPYPVTTGFIAGTGVVICALQIQDFFGLTLREHPHYFLERMDSLLTAFPTLQTGDTVIGCLTLGMLIFWSRIKIPIPGHLVAIFFGSFAAFGLPLLFPELTIATIKPSSVF